MPVYFIDPGAISGDRVAIVGPLAHHLVQSLRVKAGEELWLAENAGPRYRVRVTDAVQSRLTAHILDQTALPSPSYPHITVGLAIIKADHMDWAVQKATELGASLLVPVITRRSIIRPRDDRSARVSRWRSIALEAAQQSMRWDIPGVETPVPFDAWCTRAPNEACRLILWEGSGGPLLRERIRRAAKQDKVMIAIGPEGGFDADEIKEAERHGFDAVSLGPRILRTESALLAALAIVQYEWGDLG